MAIACKPKLLIADEPTTALDVTIQAQILTLLKALQNDLGMSMLFITHDFGVVREVADRVVVLYAGRKVEEGPVDEVFSHPLHPYTQGLLDCTLTLGKTQSRRLPEIPGTVPDALAMVKGCVFAPRCPRVIAKCRYSDPLLVHPEPQRQVACWVAAEEKGSAALAVGL
jgi:oligopeptide/dipeptide ABC transporter ATP-binding protein